MKEITTDAVLSLTAHLEKGKSACIHDLHDIPAVLRWCVAEIEAAKRLTTFTIKGPVEKHHTLDCIGIGGAKVSLESLVEKHCRKSA